MVAKNSNLVVQAMCIHTCVPTLLFTALIVHKLAVWQKFTILFSQS